MLRTEAIKLYRNILRQLQHIPDKSQQKEIRDWARADFETHRHHEDEVSLGFVLVLNAIRNSELHNQILQMILPIYIMRCLFKGL